MKKIQVLGTGCAKCKTLFANAQTAAKELGGDFQLEKVEDIKDIMKFGVLMTPALAIDGEVKCVGKVPGVEDIKKMLADKGACNA